MVQSGFTYAEISQLLQRRRRGDRGLSERTVRRFCHDHNIHYRSGLSEGDLRLAVAHAVRQVCSTYVTFFNNGFSCKLCALHMYIYMNTSTPTHGIAKCALTDSNAGGTSLWSKDDEGVSTSMWIASYWQACWRCSERRRSRVPQTETTNCFQADKPNSVLC